MKDVVLMTSPIRSLQPLFGHLRHSDLGAGRSYCKSKSDVQLVASSSFRLHYHQESDPTVASGDVLVFDWSTPTRGWSRRDGGMATPRERHTCVMVCLSVELAHTRKRA